MTQYKDQFELEYNKFLEVIDSKVDNIKLNLDKATKVCDDLIESAKKFQSGLLPDSELNIPIEEKEEVLPEDPDNHEGDE